MDTLKKILYVEDLLMSIKVLTRMCSGIYDVDYALDTEEALQKIKSQSYDLILLDINLKQPLDGLTFGKFLREEKLFENKPIILVTAYDIDSRPENLYSLGINGFIQKPFTKAELLDYLRNFI